MKKIVLMIISFLTISLNAQKKETYDTEDFLIQYPVTWELQTETNTPASFAIISPVSDEDMFSENVNLVIQNLKGKNIDLDAYIKLNKQELVKIPEGKLLVSERRKTNTSEYHVFVFTGNMNDLDIKAIQYYFLKNEMAYVLTFTTLVNEYEKYEKLAIEILDSFKLK